MRIVTIETRSLGDRSYVVHDGTTALIIDPQGDIDRIELRRRGPLAVIMAVVGVVLLTAGIVSFCVVGPHFRVDLRVRPKVSPKPA